jgi:hypothetical protein
MTMPASGRLDVHPPPLHSELSVGDRSAVGDEVWAVGMHGAPAPAVIAHTTGGKPWQLISYSSSSDAHHTTLRGVHATTSGDVWAVGSVGLPYRTHIVHGDGTTWQQVERPDGADGESLADGAAWGRDDAFAVGSRRPPPPSPLADLAGWDTLAVRWDGARWAAVPGLGHGLLSDVCAVGPGAYWAVGTARIATRAGNFALVAHHADEHWQQAGSEVPGSLSGVAATGPDDVWAVGRDQDPVILPGR